MLTNPLARADFVPADHGMVGWTYDPSQPSTGVATPVAGTLYVARIKLAQPTLITAVLMMVSGAGATLTAGQNFAAVFDSTNAQIGVTADQATPWSSAGNKDMPLTAPVSTAGAYVYVGFYANGSTLPSFRSGVNSPLPGNINLATASARYGAANTGLTTAPPGTLGTITAASVPWWIGLR